MDPASSISCSLSPEYFLHGVFHFDQQISPLSTDLLQLLFSVYKQKGSETDTQNSNKQFSAVLKAIRTPLASAPSYQLCQCVSSCITSTYLVCICVLMYSCWCWTLTVGLLLLQVVGSVCLISQEIVLIHILLFPLLAYTSTLQSDFGKYSSDAKEHSPPTFGSVSCIGSKLILIIDAVL